MAFSHTMGGTTFTQANFEGNAYSDESTGFPKAMEKMVEHVANAYRGISTTSNAVGTGSKTWTVTNSNSQIPAFAVGMPVRVARTSAPSTTFMQGEITAFNASTGSTTVNVSSVKGSGTHTDWTITVGGHQTTASASPLAIADGGTGAGTAGGALTALGGVGAGANSSITSLTGLTTPLTVAQGGSGSATHTLNNVLVGAGTGAVTSIAPSTSGNVLTSNGTVWASAAPATVVGQNLLINGSMNVSQRGTKTGLGSGTGDEYTLDRWSLATPDTSTARWTVSRETSGGTSGKDPWLKCLNTTADGSPGAGEGQLIQQKMEGYNAKALLGTGDGIIDGFTVSADMILYKDGASSISFPATVACVAYTIDTGRGCVIEATISAAATWQRVSFVFPADTSGTFNIDETLGFRVGFGLYAGTSRDAGDGAWFSAATNAATSEDAENIADATNNYFGFTNVQLNTSTSTVFQDEDYGTTLRKCLRYFERWDWADAADVIAHGASTYNQTSAATLHFQQPMRTSPTITLNTATTYRYVDQTNTVTAASSASSGAISPHSFVVNLSHGSNPTQGGGYMTAVSSTFIEASAEL